jgi:hypothetical protein
VALDTAHTTERLDKNIQRALSTDVPTASAAGHTPQQPTLQAVPAEVSIAQQTTAG